MTESLDDLRERIGNAVAAASETQPSWKHRCAAVMSALGHDFGDPDWMMPDDLRRLDAALARVAELEGILGREAIGQEEAARLLGVERGLEYFEVRFDPMLGEATPWLVRGTGPRFCRSFPSCRTRWDAIRMAAIAENNEREKFG